MEILGLLPHATNTTILGRCRAGDEAELVVYKPVAGARPLHDFDVSTLPARESATYVVSEELGWRLVPATIVRDEAPLGPGSVQAFVEHDPANHYFTLAAEREADFKRIALFDLLTNNADRKSGHCLLGTDGRIWAIDNGLTFHQHPKIRTVIWDFAGTPIPADDRKAVARLGQALEREALTRRLAALLDATELDALRGRAATLAAAENFPPPRSDWSFPWPLV